LNHKHGESLESIVFVFAAIVSALVEKEARSQREI
jgi:hypothetical protein